ncbi:TPA: Gamma-glutamyltranspeptidase, partial [Clostridioides difficile]|nr:Gamma-glutamyltranspeptidase [Clostridioides difficile]
EIKVIHDTVDMGRGQIIFKTEQESYICGTESRCDGHIAVY